MSRVETNIEYEDDQTRIVEERHIDDDGNLACITQRQEWKPGSRQANADSLRAKASAALGTNATFLGLASPTNAQISAQVKALTKQMNALIRLEVEETDSTGGT